MCPWLCMLVQGDYRFYALVRRNGKSDVFPGVVTLYLSRRARWTTRTYLSLSLSRQFWHTWPLLVYPFRSRNDAYPGPGRGTATPLIPLFDFDHDWTWEFRFSPDSPYHTPTRPSSPCSAGPCRTFGPRECRSHPRTWTHPLDICVYSWFTLFWPAQ